MNTKSFLPKVERNRTSSRHGGNNTGGVVGLDDFDELATPRTRTSAAPRLAPMGGELVQLAKPNPGTRHFRMKQEQLHHNYGQWSRKAEPLAERRSPRFFLAQRSAKANPYPTLYKGKATELAEPAVPVTPQRAVTEDVCPRAVITPALSSASRRPPPPRPPLSQRYQPHYFQNNQQQHQQHDQTSTTPPSGVTWSAEAGMSAADVSAASAATAAERALAKLLQQQQEEDEEEEGKNAQAENARQQYQQQGGGDRRARSSQVLVFSPSEFQEVASDPTEFSSCEQFASDEYDDDEDESDDAASERAELPSPRDADSDFFDHSPNASLKEDTQRPSQRGSGAGGSGRGGSGKKNNSNRRKSGSGRRQHKQQQQQQQQDSSSSDDELSASHNHNQDRNQHRNQHQNRNQNENENINDIYNNNQNSTLEEEDEDDELSGNFGSNGGTSTAGVFLNNRRAFDLIRRLFLLQVSERSVTRSFLSKLPSSQVLDRIEAVLQRVGASRFMSQDDFHLVLNQALCPNARHVPGIALVNDDVLSLSSEREKRRMPPAVGSNSNNNKNINSSSRGGGKNNNNYNKDNNTTIFDDNNQNEKQNQSNEQPQQQDHITTTESRMLFTLFEQNGLVGLQHIAEGFDLLLRGEQFALLAYTRRIVCEPDASEKESTVTVLELEWMLGALTKYFGGDLEVGSRCRKLVTKLWREAHKGCVSRRTLRIMISNDPLLLRGVQVLPKFGSTDELALRPEERPALSPDPMQTIDLMATAPAKNQNQTSSSSSSVNNKNNSTTVAGGGAASSSSPTTTTKSNNNNTNNFGRRASFIDDANSLLHSKQNAEQQRQQHQQNDSSSLQRESSVSSLRKSTSAVLRRRSTAGSLGGDSKAPRPGRGLAFESLDVHDPHFVADKFRSNDSDKQATAAEVGDPQFFSLRGQPYISVFNGQPVPIFDLSTQQKY